MMALKTEREIKNHYAGSETAAAYVQERFVSELHRLLHDRQSRVLQGLIDRTHPRRILEVAPGPGRLTRSLRPTGELVCLEFNEGMLSKGRAACSAKTQWVRGDGFQLPFDQVFDLVYSFRFIR